MQHKKFSEYYPYSYLLIRLSDNKKYIGVRYANVKRNKTPEEDFGIHYFTSGVLKKEFKKNPSNFTFRLLWTFDTLDELFDWEKKVVLKACKREDFANRGWAMQYKDNPKIGKLISEGLYTPDKDGSRPIDRRTASLLKWIYETEEGSQYRKDLSDRKKKFLQDIDQETKLEISRKRSENMDFKAARAKASVKLAEIGEDGLTGNQRNAVLGAQTRKANGTDSEIGKKRNAKLDSKLLNMTTVEFEEFIAGKAKCFVNAMITRRNRMLQDFGGTNDSA